MKQKKAESPRVLVVDDDNYIRLFLKETLESKEYQVELANDGEEALAKIKSSPPDLVLTDLKMPKKDGLELLKDVNQLDGQIGVIIITAYGTVETAVKAMKDGAFDYLTKPFSITEIESRLRRFFELNMLRKENRDLKGAKRPVHIFVGIVHTGSDLLPNTLVSIFYYFFQQRACALVGFFCRDSCNAKWCA